MNVMQQRGSDVNLEDQWDEPLEKPSTGFMFGLLPERSCCHQIKISKCLKGKEKTESF